MKRAKSHRRMSRTVRWLLAAGIIIVVFTGLWFGAQAWLGHEITNLLENEPINLDGGSYAAKVRRVRVSLARRSVTLTDVTINTPRSKKNGPVPVLDASIKRVDASGIRYRKERGDTSKTLSFRSLAIDSPAITYDGIPSPIQDSASNAPESGREPRKIHIEELSLQNGNLSISIWEGQEKNHFSGHSVDLQLEEIASETPQKSDTAQVSDHPGATLNRVLRFAKSPRIRLAADSLAYTFKNGAMKFEADSIAYDSADSILSAARVALLPQYSKYQYSLRVSDHSDWTELIVSDVDCRGINLKALLDERSFRADSLSVGGVTIDSFKDRNQPQSHRVKPTMYESVERLPIGVAIGIIDTRDINIRYEEISKGASVPGIVTFTDMNARIEGLTNRPVNPSQHYFIRARGYLLGSAAVNVELSLPADSLDNHFSLRAYVGPMSATIATPVTEPIANVRIVSGEVQSVSVEISGNSYRAQSVVDMQYTDLRIAIMRKNNPNREREFLTVIANDIVLRRDNPQRGDLRIGHGTYERDPYKSFWNYLWKTSFAGVADVIM